MFPRYFAAITVSVLFVLGCNPQLKRPPTDLSANAVTEEAWLKEVQTITAALPDATTTAQIEKNRSDLIEQLERTQSGRVITFDRLIKNVKWRNGTATILVESVDSEPGGMPMKISGFGEFEVTMPQDEATAVKPGSQLAIVGQLQFHPRKWGLVGKTNQSQQLSTLRDRAPGSNQLGTFCTQSYRITIDGRNYKGRWSDQ